MTGIEMLQVEGCWELEDGSGRTAGRSDGDVGVWGGLAEQQERWE